MQLLISLLKNIRRWDRPAQLALLLAFLLLFGTVIAGVGVPAWRQAAVWMTAGLLLVTQGVVLWGNRFMVNAYTQAQQLFIAGDFVGAQGLLENLREKGVTDVRVMTLLGNTYRQLGRLEDSAKTLRAALDKESLHHFPLYGFGRTLLAQGHYDEAVAYFQRALDNGAPEITRFDLGEALYRLHRHHEAQLLLSAVRPQLHESYRALMVQFLLFHLGAASLPDDALINAGLPYWETCVQLYQGTPYGTALAEDIRTIKTLTQKE